MLLKSHNRRNRTKFFNFCINSLYYIHGVHFPICCWSVLWINWFFLSCSYQYRCIVAPPLTFWKSGCSRVNWRACHLLVLIGDPRCKSLGRIFSINILCPMIRVSHLQCQLIKFYRQGNLLYYLAATCIVQMTGLSET